jgi:tripartite-type tricarboxylate transporter receptor subunit TctC
MALLLKEARSVRSTLLHKAVAALQDRVPARWNNRFHKLNEPLVFVVGYSLGGNTDRMMRLIAQPLAARLGVPVEVMNRPGEGGRLAAREVRRATKRQNMLLLGNPAMMITSPLLCSDVGYRPADDFVPMVQVSSYDYAVATAPDVSPNRLLPLVTWLWANPQSARFCVPGTGGLPHFFALMLGEVLGIRYEVTAYKGSAPLLADLTAGRATIAIDRLDSLYPQHLAGKLHVLAASGNQSAVFAPDVPTFRESGLEIDATGWDAVFAPRAMPRGKVRMIAEAIRDVMQDTRLRKAFDALYATPVASTMAETAAMIDAFRQKWEPAVRRSGMAHERTRSDGPRARVKKPRPVVRQGAAAQRF